MTPSQILIVAVQLNASVLFLLAILVLTAWTQRRNRFVLLGTIAIILTFGAAVTLDRTPLWVGASLMMIAGWCAIVALGLLLARIISHFRRRAKQHLG